MSSSSTRGMVVLALASLSTAVLPVTAPAGEVVVAIQAEITGVTDSMNWFNESIHVGTSVSGSYNVFDSGYERLEIPPSTSFYQFFFQSNAGGFPVQPVSMHLG